MSFVQVPSNVDLSGLGEEGEAEPETPSPSAASGGGTLATALAAGRRFVLTPQIAQTVTAAARQAERRKWLWIGGGAAALAGAAAAAWYFLIHRRSGRSGRGGGGVAGDDEAQESKRSNKGKRGSRGYRLSPSTSIQTLIFPKTKFKTPSAVRDWLADHSEFTGGKIDATGSSFRVRQQAPGRMGPKSFRTIALGRSGVKAVVAKKKEYSR